MQMKTLQEGISIQKAPHSRQFAAIYIKDWIVNLVSPCALITIVVFTALFTGLLGGLHQFFANQNGSTVNTSSSGSTPVSMPLEGSPSNINHRIQFTLPRNSDGQYDKISKTLVDYFGQLPENATGWGYLAAADKQFDDVSGPQTRALYAVSGATYNVDGSLYIPFSDNATSQSHLWCNLSPEEMEENPENCNLTSFLSYDDFDQYQNTTAYNLMYQEVDAEHADDNGTSMSQFNYDKHAELYTSGINYTYFQSLYNKLGETQPKQLGYNYTISTYTSHQTQLGYNLTNFFHIGGTQYFLYQLFLRNNFEPQNTQVPQVSGYYKYLWTQSANTSGDPYTPLFSALLIPIAILLICSMLSYNMSYEKQEGQQSIQKMMGMRYSSRYWGDFIFNLSMGTIVTLLVFIIQIACGMETITRTNWFINILLYGLFDLNIPVLSNLCSSFTDSGKVASVVALVYVLVISIIGIVYAGNSFESSDSLYMNFAWALLPAMGPVVMLVDIGALVAQQDPAYYLSSQHFYYFSLKKNLDMSAAADTGYQCACACFVGYLFTVLYALLAYYLDKICPRKNGIPEHPLFMFQRLYEQACFYNRDKIQELSARKVAYALGTFFKHPSIVAISQLEIDRYMTLSQPSTKLTGDTTTDTSKEGTSTTDLITTNTTNTNNMSTVESSTTAIVNSTVAEQKKYIKGTEFKHNSQDLIKEKQNCMNNISYTGGTPLINIINLNKIYKSKYGQKHAVKDLYYNVGSSEIFVLLGPNGCGKTTHINIISKLFKPTSGSAFVGGISILQNVPEEQFMDLLGICPQFDIVYPKLTVMQHMQFYARMKGINKSIENTHIRELLYSVGLYDAMNVKANSLSGGMKRRLAIAISLLNKPKIIILDEPSSGLDVSTRRQIWNIILRYKKGRAILLTTHAMEEAEALASRVGIMADGKLLAVDTVSQLKNRFAQGYQLIVNCKKIGEKKNIQQEGKIQLNTVGEQQANYEIKEKFNKSMILVQCYQGKLTYIVNKDIAISKVFSIMEQMCNDEKSNIADYSLNQANLESVFMTVVKNSVSTLMIQQPVFDDLKFDVNEEVPTFEIVCVDEDSKKIMYVTRECTKLEFSGAHPLLIANISLEQNKTGMTYYNTFANQIVSPIKQFKAMGYLSGLLWADLINLHNGNMHQWFCYDYITGCTEDNVYPEYIYAYYQENLEYLRQQAYSLLDNYWIQVSYTLAHFDSLVKGYQQATINDPSKYLSELDLWIYLCSGDLLDVAAFPQADQIYKPAKLSKQQLQHIVNEYNKDNKNLTFDAYLRNSQDQLSPADDCSGLIKVDYEQGKAWAGQTSWFYLTSGIKVRQSIHYSFDGENIKSMVFSSYPGFSYSFDDIYQNQDNLIGFETTNDVYISEMYDLCDPDQVPAFIRSQIAMRISEDAYDGVIQIGKFNSGTYNNQWNFLYPTNDSVQLFTLEQMPGFAPISNYTQRLIDDTYFPSFNIPSMQPVFIAMGYVDSAQTDPTSRYYNNPRYEIFTRNQSTITTFSDFKAMMRYNNYLEDPLSYDNVTQKQDSKYAITSRYDLATPEQHNSCFGGTGSFTVEVDYKQNTSQNAYISSPAYEHVKPFVIQDAINTGLFCVTDGFDVNQEIIHYFVDSQWVDLN